MLLTKTPVPVPSDVLVDSAVVGLADVLQHIPREVIVAPPSLVTLPPAVAVDDVMADAPVVVTEGKIANVVNVESPP